MSRFWTASAWICRAARHGQHSVSTAQREHTMAQQLPACASTALPSSPSGSTTQHEQTEQMLLQTADSARQQ